MDDRAADLAFSAMSDVVLAVAAELALEPVLRKLVHAARALVGARYAALGTPDAGGGGFGRFLTSGMSDELIERIGNLPRTHGLLGAMLTEPAPFRTDDVAADPRFEYWPAAHPRMRAFLGVPIVAKGDVIGAFYLADKEDGPQFTDADQRAIELLAAHAAVAIEHAQLYERSREASVMEERNRLARELHDAMTQTLFSLDLTAEVAAGLVRTDPGRAEAEIRRVQQLARATMAELRSLIFELRPAELEADGLVRTLAKHLDVLRRTSTPTIDLVVQGDRRLDPETELEVFRVVSEALHNALRHAGAANVRVEIAVGATGVRTVVADDGKGFDPDARAIRARRLGLTSMRERARALGGTLVIRSEPGHGTTVVLEVPGA